jgi:hypothetical protein
VSDDEKTLHTSKGGKVKKSMIKKNKIKVQRQPSADTDELYLTSEELCEIKNSVAFKRSLEKKMLSNPTVTLHTPQSHHTSHTYTTATLTPEGVLDQSPQEPQKLIGTVPLETSSPRNYNKKRISCATPVVSTLTQNTSHHTTQHTSTIPTPQLNIVSTPMVGSNVDVNTESVPQHMGNTALIQGYLNQNPVDSMSRVMNPNFQMTLPRLNIPQPSLPLIHHPTLSDPQPGSSNVNVVDLTSSRN